MNIEISKKRYVAPHVDRIEIDNEISLVLQSDDLDSYPITGPDEAETP